MDGLNREESTEIRLKSADTVLERDGELDVEELEMIIFVGGAGNNTEKMIEFNDFVDVAAEYRKEKRLSVEDTNKLQYAFLHRFSCIDFETFIPAYEKKTNEKFCYEKFVKIDFERMVNLYQDYFGKICEDPDYDETVDYKYNEPEDKDFIRERMNSFCITY